MKYLPAKCEKKMNGMRAYGSPRDERQTQRRDGEKAKEIRNLHIASVYQSSRQVLWRGLPGWSLAVRRGGLKKYENSQHPPKRLPE